MADDKDDLLGILHATDLVIEAGQHAAELMDQVGGRGERAREYFRRLADLFNLYTSPDNLAKPHHPLPAIIAKQLSNLFEHLSAGIITDPIKHCARRGRPVGPDAGRDVRYEVIYELAAKRGLFPDRHPLKKIAEEYGLSSRKTVQTWIVKHQKTVALESFADPELVMDRMREAAQRYRVSGRHHNAIRNRASKKPSAKMLTLRIERGSR